MMDFVGSPYPTADTSIDELWALIERDGPVTDADDLDADLLLADWSERTHSQADRRRTFIAFYSWAVPNRETVAEIRKFVGDRKVLEVCSGAGLWAKLLSSEGIDVIATEPIPAKKPYVSIEEAEAGAAVRAHRDCDALLLVWPPFRDDCAFRALRSFGGTRVILVGDPQFCADRQFHAALGREWALFESHPIPSWPGLEDAAYFYVRRIAHTV
jgi:hypothetical protein